MCNRVALANSSLPTAEQNPSSTSDLPANQALPGREIINVVCSSLIFIKDSINDCVIKICAIMKKWFDEISALTCAFCAVIGEFVSGTSLEIKELTTEEDFLAYCERVAELEAKAEYPLGPNEKFKINHGEDYFAFFKRLGEVHYFVCLDNDKVVGVGAGCLRTIENRKVWYLCDLKVIPEYRGRYIPMHMFKKAAYLATKSTTGYAISMNPAEGENRIVRMFRNYSWIPVSQPKQLAIFSLDHNEVETFRQDIEAHKGKMSFLSMKGKKDLILQSTQKPLPLLHAQFGKTDAQEPTFEAPQEGFTHMFCVPQEDPLCQKLDAKGLKPSATASILSRGMEDIDLNFILTSEI